MGGGLTTEDLFKKTIDGKTGRVCDSFESLHFTGLSSVDLNYFKKPFRGRFTGNLVIHTLASVE